MPELVERTFTAEQEIQKKWRKYEQTEIIQHLHNFIKENKSLNKVWLLLKSQLLLYNSKHWGKDVKQSRDAIKKVIWEFFCRH